MFILLRQNHGTVAGRGAKIKTCTNGVWCKALTVEKFNAKACRYFWGNDINVRT